MPQAEGSRRISPVASSLKRRRGVGEVTQSGDERAEVIAIVAPSALRAAVDRLAYLDRAGSAHRALGLVKGDAARIPREPAKPDELLRLGFDRYSGSRAQEQIGGWK